MERNLFISHSSYDKKVVQVLANLIKKVSLNQVHIWFSNDQETYGGFLAGDSWFETIFNNLQKSQAVISFITPNSNNNPWILFESGYAEALENTKLIPLKFLVNINEISSPLHHKQIFSMLNIDEANTFLRKVLGCFNIIYDEEIFSDYVNKCLNEMRSCYESKDVTNEENAFELLSKKMDNYFNLILKRGDLKEEKQFEYEVSIEFENLSGNIIKEYIKINSLIKVNDVLDSIFFILNGRVKAYKYMEEWIIKEKGINRYVVVSDVQNLIFARDIFRIGTEWMIEFLDEPYKPNNIFNSEHDIVNMESYAWYK